MLHRLCEPPSIPLSFSLATILPRRGTTTFASAASPCCPPPSTHRLGLGLPGYLIPFTPLAFAPQRQLRSSLSPSPPEFHQISTHFTAPLGVPQTPTSLQVRRIWGSATVELWSFTRRRADPPTRPLSPVIPNNVCTVRLTAAAGTNLARAYCTSVSLPWYLWTLQPEGLRRPRGVARSGLPPLPKILDCSLP
jgi:hypothetical protein